MKRSYRKQNMKKLILLLSMCMTMTTTAIAVEITDDQISELAQRYRSLLTIERGERMPAKFQKEMDQQDRLIQQVLDKQIMDPSDDLYGTWGEVTDLQSPKLVYNGAWTINVLLLAEAYSRPSSKFHDDEEVLNRLDIAFKGYGKFVYPGCPKPGNWWAWDIGMPMRLVDIYILLKDDLPQETSQFLKSTLAHLTKETPVGGLGANAIWLAWIQFRYGLSTGDRKYLDLGYSCLNRQSMITPGLQDGIKPDYSYSFHAPGLNMGYGTSHFADMSNFVFLTHGTPYEMADEKVHVDFLLEFIRWTLFETSLDVYTCGRAGTRDFPGVRSERLTGPAMALVGLGLQETEQIIAECKRFLAADPDFISLKFAPEQAIIENSPVPVSEMDGFRYFPYTSYGAWHGNDFMASIRVDSTRNKKWFSIHSENLLGHRITDGHLAVWTKNEIEQKGLLPCQDWKRLTAITAAPGYVLPNERIGQTTITGGVSPDDEFGFVAMRLTVQPQPEGPSFRANKSYLMLDNAVICLTSNADVEGDDSVVPYTSLAQIVADPEEKHQLTTESFEQTLDAPQEWKQGFDWLWFNNRGLVCLRANAYELSWKTESATWGRINKRIAPNEDWDTIYKASFLTVQRNHETPEDILAYALLPHATQEEVKAWGENNTVELIQTDENVHILKVKTRDYEITAMAFFQPTEEGSFQCDSPALLVIGNDANSTLISAVQLDAQHVEPANIVVPFQLTNICNDKIEISSRNGKSKAMIKVSGLESVNERFPSSETHVIENEASHRSK